MHLNINTSAVVVFTNKLEKMKRSALPSAIRNTLSRTAMDVKKVTMPESSEKHFVNRNKTFFKANSRVEFAKGWDVKTMKAVVGFTPHTAQHNNQAVRDLQQQEYGGDINDRAFIPLDDSRSGGISTPVRPMNRLARIRNQVGDLKNIPDVRKTKGRSAKEKFIKTALGAGSWRLGGGAIANWTASKRIVENGFMIAGMHGKRILYRINSLQRIGNKTKVNTTPIYSLKTGRSVSIDDDTHFMREASLKSARKMETFYIEEANKQIARLKK